MINLTKMMYHLTDLIRPVWSGNTYFFWMFFYF